MFSFLLNPNHTSKTSNFDPISSSSSTCCSSPLQPSHCCHLKQSLNCILFSTFCICIHFVLTLARRCKRGWSGNPFHAACSPRRSILWHRRILLSMLLILEVKPTFLQVTCLELVSLFMAMFCAQCNNSRC